MKHAYLLVTLGLVTGCGAAGADAPPPSTPPPTTAIAPACPPGSTDSPNDAQPRMASLQADVRKCYALATGSADSEVKVEITIGATGDVRHAAVLGGKSDPSARTCLERTLNGAKFASFCGPDVSIRWTYALR